MIWTNFLHYCRFFGARKTKIKNKNENHIFIIYDFKTASGHTIFTENYLHDKSNWMAYKNLQSAWGHFWHGNPEMPFYFEKFMPYWEMSSLRWRCHDDWKNALKYICRLLRYAYSKMHQTWQDYRFLWGLSVLVIHWKKVPLYIPKWPPKIFFGPYFETPWRDAARFFFQSLNGQLSHIFLGFCTYEKFRG